MQSSDDQVLQQQIKNYNSGRKIPPLPNGWMFIFWLSINCAIVIFADALDLTINLTVVAAISAIAVFSMGIIYVYIYLDEFKVIAAARQTKEKQSYKQIYESDGTDAIEIHAKDGETIVCPNCDAILKICVG